MRSGSLKVFELMLVPYKSRIGRQVLQHPSLCSPGAMRKLKPKPEESGMDGLRDHDLDSPVAGLLSAYPNRVD